MARKLGLGIDASLSQHGGRAHPPGEVPALWHFRGNLFHSLAWHWAKQPSVFPACKHPDGAMLVLYCVAMAMASPPVDVRGAAHSRRQTPPSRTAQGTGAMWVLIWVSTWVPTQVYPWVPTQVPMQVPKWVSPQVPSQVPTRVSLQVPP